MKSRILLIIAFLIAVTSVSAQTWSELSQEQKAMKAKEFRADNQKYLKTELGMNQTQLDDIDNINLCYLSTLDRIDRYTKVESNKDILAEAVGSARAVQLDAIMGADKHKKYAEYIKGKIAKMK